MDSDPENKHLDDKDAIEGNSLDDKTVLADPVCYFYHLYVFY